MTTTCQQLPTLPTLPPLVLAACVLTRIDGVTRKRYALTTPRPAAPTAPTDQED